MYIQISICMMQHALISLHPYNVVCVIRDLLCINKNIMYIHVRKTYTDSDGRQIVLNKLYTYA